MGNVHYNEARTRGGVYAVQCSQRDWSPFVAHFTSKSAMKSVTDAVQMNARPTDVKAALDAADAAAMGIVQQIAQAGRLSVSPSGCSEVPSRLSLSECSLAGLLGLCERYGRFGFVFDKDVLLALGGGPCLYLRRPLYSHLKALAQREGPGSPEHEILALANVHAPGHLDFTHEREWRVFTNIDLSTTPPRFLICPAAYLSQMRKTFGPDRVYVPIDSMYAWGV